MKDTNEFLKIFTFQVLHKFIENVFYFWLNQVRNIYKIKYNKKPIKKSLRK